MPRVLLVDDSALIRNSMQSVLEPLGLELGHAENGKIAVDKARSESWDLIFLDVVMPIMDGLIANILGEHPAEQLSPRQPVGTRRDGVRGTWAGSMSGVAAGRHQRAELRAGFAGRAEDPRVPHEMAPGRRDDADQPAQKRDRFEHQLGAAVGPRPLELQSGA